METMFRFLSLIVMVAMVECSIVRLNVTETDGAGTLIVNTTGSGNCSFDISPGKVKEYFRLDEEHNLVLSKSLDLEVDSFYQYYNDTEGLNVTVKCAEGPVFQTSIFVIPVNEFKPEFNGLPYLAIVPEDTPIGSPVFCVFCEKKLVSDGDRIRYGNVSNFTFIPHEIQGLDGAHMFSIDPDSGNITTMEQFDYESRNRLFYVKLRVQDDGGRTGEASVGINVTDVDDNPPKFTRPGCDDVACNVTKYSADIDSFLQGEISSIISPSRIYAKDIDSGINNQLEYTMTSDDDPDLISNIMIDNRTGELFVQEPFYNITNVSDNSPIRLTFDITATEISDHGYSTNVTLVITLYRSMTTLPPSTTVETSGTTRVLVIPLQEEPNDGLGLLLVEILVPLAIVIGITTVIVVILVKRSRKLKERSNYDVKDGVKVYSNVIGDRDMAVQATSPLVINPYELVTLYEASHYAKLDSIQERGKTRDDGQGQTEGHDEVHSSNADNNDEASGDDTDVVVESINIDTMYARVDKKRPKSSKSDARDVFGSDNHGNNILEGETNEDDTLPEDLKDVKNIEY